MCGQYKRCLSEKENVISVNMLFGIRNRRMRRLRQTAKEESRKAKLIRLLNKALDLADLEAPRFRWIDPRTRIRCSTPPELWKVGVN